MYYENEYEKIIFSVFQQMVCRLTFATLYQNTSPNKYQNIILKRILVGRMPQKYVHV